MESEDGLYDRGYLGSFDKVFKVSHNALRFEMLTLCYEQVWIHLLHVLHEVVKLDELKFVNYVKR